ncbi:protein NRT1/ PTR FAMILY 8.1 [Selaginella moellendorffii]|uniref:protein NRT1/ PTR FAMILY 8.1 n=1 Tax=Selaginella moellendorffii TaxID=88036 RepID=UPI000D1C8260|nr:protein NRT1/ PTR FAMILY 8.1 [Selaginella moellendorffii]|eukprot:XP_024517546.1 protein NRT1/ PTR FAMILY 8.1 [Selaginella moellendorffii]
MAWCACSSARRGGAGHGMGAGALGGEEREWRRRKNLLLAAFYSRSHSQSPAILSFFISVGLILVSCGMDKIHEELEQEQQDATTRDGTVDWFGKPAAKGSTGTQTFASVGFCGVWTNLVLYLSRVLHERNSEAANAVTNWVGTSYLSSLLGGFLADAYWGKYRTNLIFLTIYLLKALLYLGLYTVAVGYGGYQPCISSFGGDQFDKEDPLEQKQATTFFSWYYMSMMVGAIISATLIVYVEDSVSWSCGFAISTAAAAASIIIFLIGTRLYRHQKTGGNPLTRVVKVFTAAAFKLYVEVPSDSSQLYEVDSAVSAIQGSRKIQHTPNFRFLDKAAVKLDTHDDINISWRLCTVTQVEEVKCMMRLLPIWSTTIIFSTLYTQVSTLFVEQGAGMNTLVGNFKILPGSLSTFCMLSVILCSPAYEWLLVPAARKLTGKERGITNLQRMGTGKVVVTTAMVCAAFVEVFRLKSVARTNSAPLLSDFWQLPQYFLVGLSEVFAYSGQLDFFYEQSPDAMRGVGLALSQCSFALGNYLSSLQVVLVTKVTGWLPDDLNRGNLDYYFWFLTILSFVNLAFYLFCSLRYKLIQINHNDSVSLRASYAQLDLDPEDLIVERYASG